MTKKEMTHKCPDHPNRDKLYCGACIDRIVQDLETEFKKKLEEFREINCTGAIKPCLHDGPKCTQCEEFDNHFAEFLKEGK